jgi:AraC family transcriptional regulator
MFRIDESGGRMRLTDGFGGTQVLSSTFGAVAFSETRYRPAGRMERHVHPQGYFCIVRGGGFREEWRGGSSIHGSGDVIFHAPGDAHANTFLSEGARCWNVVLDDALLAGLSIPYPRTVLTRRAVRPLVTALQRELGRADRSALIVEGLVYQVLGETLQRETPFARRPAWLEHVRETIRTRFDAPLSVADLAADVGVHPVHLSRAFHRRFGVAVAAEVRRVRVEEAARLLRHSALPLSDVAAAAGFADQSHLTRVFKRAKGTTPARYRREH